ncbi:hypothetical protein [Bacillus thermotolerans]|uniref:Uncharacterized protein n=2 Tax=Bacillus thermotolerans TaxID=1221996 RepID=A0A0F5HSI6_BACTR|nr:hypothetical protein [Bacillus thermotolerans]KKB35990.1 hypothetical protein QY95_03238 [Bacillus thermotolerans]
MKPKGLISFVFCLSLYFSFGSLVTTAHAESVNNVNGIEISDETFNNLLSLGFTKDEIENMSEEVYNLNKNLKGEIVASQTQYLKIIENPDTIKSPFLYNDLQTDPIIVELDEATYNKEVAQEKKRAEENQISPMDITVESSTSYKTMRTVIARLGTQNYRLKQSITWSKMPSNRYVDVTGIGINPSFWGPTPDSQYGEQKWTTYSHMSGTQSHSAIYNTSSTKWSKGIGGYALRIDLPNDSFGGGADAKTVRSLTSYMYYAVRPAAVNNRLDAFGHYAHQEKNSTISPSISLSGLAFSVSPTTSFSYHPNTHVLKTNP